ncbi:MAG TPA: zinc ABC transporter substrate-binding protein [Baekduia sp.]|nr:zinc ABC transporter substrate-binding protein [Baekduia sp.]
MPAPFDLPFVQRGVVEVLLLALGSGVLGTWIVLRGLSFYAHAVGTAAFPGLVLADGLAFSPLLGAAATAGAVAIGVAVLTRREHGEGHDAATALVLAGALAAGVILASDVFHSQGSVERLLFGSLLAIDTTDQLVAAAAAAAALVGGVVLGRRWLVSGFDPVAARALGAQSSLPDAVLLVLVAAMAVAALNAIGALLATALLVVPAATTRLLVDRLARWQVATVGLAAAEGVVGLWLSVELNAPPGATIAALAAAVFGVVALARALRPRRVAVAIAAVALLAAAAVAAGCGSTTGSTAPDGRIAVVATTTELGDLVREAGGRAVAVTQLLQPNSDPHDYEPRPHDVEAVARAQLVVTSGDGLDAWMDEVLHDAGGDPIVLDAGEDRPIALPGPASGADAGTFDPHWWHDPRNVRSAVTRIHDQLIALEPSARPEVDRATTGFLTRLRALDRGIRACISRLPAADRELVTDHDAFRYFAARYGLRIVGAVIPSQTTQAQPSAGDLAELARLVRREHVRAIFPEHAVSPALARALARQTGATADAALYGDTLGPAGSPGATYLGMEAANADAIVRGLSGGRRRCHLPTEVAR